MHFSARSKMGHRACRQWVVGAQPVRAGLPPVEVTRLWNDEIKCRLARARERVARGEPLGRSADEVYADAEARIQAIRARRGR